VRHDWELLACRTLALSDALRRFAMINSSNRWSGSAFWGAARPGLAILSLAWLGAAMGLSGCQKPDAASKNAPQADSGPSPNLDARSCLARASAVWTGARGAYTIDAMTDGPDCRKAVATLVIRDPSGRPLAYTAYEAAAVLPLADKAAPAQMEAALRDWISSGGRSETTADLPEWKADAASPAAGDGEFPFLPEGDMDRATYDRWRGKAAPMFCYIQGMESERCWAFADDDLILLGVRTFPG
jgi:hypothetical protein